MKKLQRSHLSICKTLYIAVLAFSLVSCSDTDESSNGQERVVMMERGYDEVFTFEVLPGMGPGSISKEGNTLDLLLSIPYLLASGMLPPDFVINEILAKGRVDAGMGGGAEWPAYQLRKGEFGPLLQALNASSETHSVVYREPDDWVKNFEDWHVWVMYVKHGIPWQEHKRLNDAVVAIEQELVIAKNNKDEARIAKLHLENIKAGTALAEYITKHLDK